MLPYRVLARKREGESLSADELAAVARGATDGSWSDAQLGAFLMAAAVRGLDGDETRALTEAMLGSGERWNLAREVPGVCDKHSTGGVGDKVSLVIAPLLAEVGVPVAMLTGRGLGHTGGTADKLEAIPGLDVALDRERTLRLLAEVGVAIGTATAEIAPADRRLYALRDQTATVESLPLIVASILSKKLATGAAALVLDVKTGSGAFLRDPVQAGNLAAKLVETAVALGCPTVARLTDMSQPLGRWVGHAGEVGEALETLRGEGPPDLEEVTLVLAAELCALRGVDRDIEELRTMLRSGAAERRFLDWAAAQGAEPRWLEERELPLAPHEVVVEAEGSGWLAAVDTRQVGLLLLEAGAGRRRAGEAIDFGVALRVEARLGDRVESGQPLARLWLRRPDDELAGRLAAAYELSESPVAPPPLIGERLAAAGA